MYKSLACGIASIFVTCGAVQNSEAPEGLCLLQTKVAKYGGSQQSQDAVPDDSAIDSAKPTSEEVVLLSSSSDEEVGDSDDVSDENKLQGITDLEAYGGSMMDLVLGGWRHSNDNPAKTSTQTPSVASAAVEVVRTPRVARAPEVKSMSKHLVDAFGEPIRDMDVELLSAAPARVRANPMLEDTPAVEHAESGPSEEQADQVLAAAQKSLEPFSSVFSEVEKISLLGETADESKSAPAQEESQSHKSDSRPHHKASVQHKSVAQQRVPAIEHATSKKHEVVAPKKVSGVSDSEAQNSTIRPVKVSARQPDRQQKHPHLASVL